MPCIAPFDCQGVFAEQRGMSQLLLTRAICGVDNVLHEQNLPAVCIISMSLSCFLNKSPLHQYLRARLNSTCSILICPHRCCARSEAACCSALLILPLGGGVRDDTSKAWFREVAGQRKASTMADMSPCTSLQPKVPALQTTQRLRCCTASVQATELAQGLLDI